MEDEVTVDEGTPGDLGPVPLDPAPSEVASVAHECVAGHWGRGNVRRRRLAEAGYNVDAVLAEVDNILNHR